MEGLLREAHFPHVELSNACDLECGMHLGGRLALSLGQNDVHQVLVRRHRVNLLEIVQHHLGSGVGEVKEVVERRGGATQSDVKNSTTPKVTFSPAPSMNQYQRIRQDLQRDTHEM